MTVDGQRWPVKAGEETGEVGEEGRRAEAAKEGNVLDLNRVDLEVIATALADQADGEHQWLIDPTTAELVLWTSDTGIDGHNPPGDPPLS